MSTTTELILDAVAAKAGTVAGIKKAFGSGAGSSSVAPMPDQIADGPVAIVMYDGSTVLNASSFEHIEHRFRVEVYVAAVDQGYAYKTLIPFISRFVVAFRTDRDLGGVCTESHVDGADAIEPVEINARPYSRLPIRVVVQEVTPGVTTSI